MEYDPASATVIGLRPGTECSIVEAVCLTAFGQYALVIDEVEDTQGVYDIFVQETQTAIDDGLLEEQLNELDPDSIFSVEGASEPVVKPPLPQTIPPTELTEESNSNDGDRDPTKTTPEEQESSSGGGGIDGVMLGLIVAISVTACIVCILLVLFFYLKSSTPSDQIGKGTAGDGANGKGQENPAPMESYPGEKEESGDESDWPHSNHLNGNDGDMSEDAQKLAYRQRIEELVQQQCPEELENIDKMLEQFEGREMALIAMLENMDVVERELEKDQGFDAEDDENEWSDGSDSSEQRASFANREEEKEEEKEEVQEMELSSEKDTCAS